LRSSVGIGNALQVDPDCLGVEGRAIVEDHIATQIKGVAQAITGYFSLVVRDKPSVSGCCIKVSRRYAAECQPDDALWDQCLELRSAVDGWLVGVTTRRVEGVLARGRDNRHNNQR
jgi:hypothetical protein